MKGQQELFGKTVLHPPTHTHIHPHLVWWMDEQQELCGWIFFCTFTAVIIYIIQSNINKLLVRNPIMGCSPHSMYVRSESMFWAWGDWIRLWILELRFSTELWYRLQDIKWSSYKWQYKQWQVTGWKERETSFSTIQIKCHLFFLYSQVKLKVKILCLSHIQLYYDIQSPHLTHPKY